MFTENRDVKCSRVYTRKFLMVNVLDCNLKVSEFKLKPYYYIYLLTSNLEKGMNPVISLAMG